MIIKDIVIEDFLQYKKPSMFIITSKCDFKCEKECGIKGICQNSYLNNLPNKNILNSYIIEKFNSNPIIKAIVFGGLEPFDQWEELFSFINLFRLSNNEDIVIYTGYKEVEILDKINILSNYKNIIVKFGRFIPNQKPHLDDILGVALASDNQYAREISER